MLAVFFNDYHFSFSSAEPPDPPAAKPFVAKCANGILKIVWPGTTYDGGCIVTGYLVEMYDESTKKWKTLTSNVFSTGYDVKGLKADGKYKFRVSCINEVGTSKPSTESDFISPKDHEGEGKLDVTLVFIPKKVSIMILPLDRGIGWEHRRNLKTQNCSNWKGKTTALKPKNKPVKSGPSNCCCTSPLPPPLPPLCE